MPGTPVRYDTLKKVEAEGGWEPILDEIREGVTVGVIAARFGVSRGFFSSLLNEDPTRKKRVEAARRDGATSMLEVALEDSDNVNEARDSIAKAKLKADVRIKLAAMFDPERYGQRVNQGAVINIQELHLDALLSRRAALTLGVGSEPVDPPSVPAEAPVAQLPDATGQTPQ